MPSGLGLVRLRPRHLAAALAVCVAVGAGAAWWKGSRTGLDREWRIGADHAPPYYFLRPDGTTEGLAVDVLNSAAKRSGVKLKWVRVEPPETLDIAFEKGKVDLWPAVSWTPTRAETLLFTEPWLENSYGLLTRTDLDPPVVEVEDIRGRRIAIRGTAIFVHLAGQMLPPAEWTQFPEREPTVQAVCRGEAEAAVVEVRFLDTIMMERPEGCETAKFRLIMIPGASTQLRVMSTPEAHAAALRLRAAITQLALDNHLTATLEKWSALASQDTRSAYELERTVHIGKLTRYALGGVALILVLFIWLYRQARLERQRSREALSAAERANAAKSEFLANMSHEIRTPLNAIIGITQLVIESEEDETKREELESVRVSAEALMRIISDILDLSKIEAGHVKLENAPFDLKGLIEDVVSMFRAHAHSKGLALNVDYQDGMSRGFSGDAVRIRQVVTNLVGNAVKFTSTGKVTVEVRRRAHRGLWRMVAITVRDTGIGIAPEVQTQLFRKFQQADASTSRTYGGTGLGLAICRQLMDLMGGTIRLESEPGVGSAFIVELGLEAEAWKQSATVKKDLAGVAAGHGSGRILVAEDNALNQKVMLRALDRLRYHVDLAANGQEALALWASHPYDLILMDCQMPGIDGYQATARIREAERTTGRRTPIVAVTASAMESERLRCIEAGMDDYIAKPFDLERLRGKVLQYAGKATSTSPFSA